MNQNGEDDRSAPNFRTIINRIRRRNASWKLVLLAVTWLWVWWLATHGSGSWFPAGLASILALQFVLAALDRLECCPGCRRHISWLPSEGLDLIPKLSTEVIACPFCAADFRVDGSSPAEGHAPGRAQELPPTNQPTLTAR
jgi:hypothetical protein